MKDNYRELVKNNLKRLYADLPPDLASLLPAEQEENTFSFPAFGGTCTVSPDGVSFDRENVTSIFGILISLYALNASSEVPINEPFRSFKELPDSMPYTGAFTTHTEQILVPHVDAVKTNRQRIIENLRGTDAPASAGGDISFVVRPLPKLSLCYIFYEADDDFPASVTCLYSNNADRFLPIDGLADVGEYTSKTILSLIGA